MPSSLLPTRVPPPARPSAHAGRRAAVLLAAVALAAAPAAAQHLELLSAASGRPLPAGYYERIGRDPHFFDTRYEWRHRAAAAQGASVGANGASLLVEGNLRMVLMPALFADSGEPPVGAGALQQQLFGINPLGNLTQYYREVSGERLTVQGTVLPWVRTSLTAQQVAGSQWGLGAGNNLAWYLRETVERLDATVNFGQYDNDGSDNVPNSGDDDGRVDMAVVLIAERSAECGNDASIWPHHASLWAILGQPYPTNDETPGGDPILVDDYHVESVLNCDGSPRGIATLAHEVGHALGLPDLYDASGTITPPGERRWVLGCWTLMAAGALGCGDGTVLGRVETPPHMGPWEKIELGWMHPAVAQPGYRREYRLEPVQLTGQALKVPLVGDDEYLLLEYRTRTGYDQSLPAGGVLVYHVEITRPFSRGCITCIPLYRVMLIEADGDGALRKRPVDGGNRGVAGDVFAGRRFLSDFTSPSLRRHDGERSNLHLEIDVALGWARILVSTPPVVATPALVAPLLGTGAPSPTADERAALDLFGNRNGAYDMGDLRAYMRIRPGTVVPAS